MTTSTSLSFEWDGEEYYSMSQLIKNRDWTKSLIKKYLGEPCATRPNPHYRNAAPMKLYLRSLVLDTEQLNSFIEDKAAALISADMARQRSINRISSCIEVIADADVKPFKISLNTLLHKSKKALEVKKNNNEEIFKIENAEEIMAVGILFDIASPSMYSVDNSFGMPGVRIMREIMRTRILESIKVNFPELGDVCKLIEKKVDLGTPEMDLNVLAKLH